MEAALIDILKTHGLAGAVILGLGWACTVLWGRASAAADARLEDHKRMLEAAAAREREMQRVTMEGAMATSRVADALKEITATMAEIAETERVKREIERIREVERGRAS